MHTRQLIALLMAVLSTSHLEYERDMDEKDLEIIFLKAKLIVTKCRQEIREDGSFADEKPFPKKRGR